MMKVLTILYINVMKGKTKLPFWHLEIRDKAADKCHQEFYIIQTYTPCVSKGMILAVFFYFFSRNNGLVHTRQS